MFCGKERPDLARRRSQNRRREVSLSLSLSLSDAALPCSARPPVLKRSALSSTALLKAAPLEVCWYEEEENSFSFSVRNPTEVEMRWRAALVPLQMPQTNQENTTESRSGSVLQKAQQGSHYCGVRRDQKRYVSRTTCSFYFNFFSS